MTDVAFSIIVPVILGFLLGINLDKLYSPKFPVWTLILTLMGFAIGMWSLYKR